MASVHGPAAAVPAAISSIDLPLIDTPEAGGWPPATTATASRLAALLRSQDCLIDQLLAARLEPAGEALEPKEPPEHDVLPPPVVPSRGMAARAQAAAEAVAPRSPDEIIRAIAAVAAGAPAATPAPAVARPEPRELLHEEMERPPMIIERAQVALALAQPIETQELRDLPRSWPGFVGGILASVVLGGGLYVMLAPG